jgi:hypothetical protein
MLPYLPTIHSNQQLVEWLLREFDDNRDEGLRNRRTAFR